jgi:hypothetical protein
MPDERQTRPKSDSVYLPSPVMSGRIMYTCPTCRTVTQWQPGLDECPTCQAHIPPPPPLFCRPVLS